METLTFRGIEAEPWKNLSTVSQRESKPSPSNSIAAIPLTVDALMRQRAEEAPETQLVSYPSSGINYVNYTARQLDTFAFRVAQKYATTMPPRSSSSQTAIVVGLLGPSNFDYLVTILALTKLGHTVLFLSTRISPAAYQSLLKATGAANLLIDESFKNLAETLSPGLPKLKIDTIAKSHVYEGPLGAVKPDTCLTHRLDPEAERNQLAWIIHSSGSTGLPKPIFQTQSAALGNYRNNLNMRGFVTLPLYHAHGISSLFRSIQSWKSIHLYNASLPLTHAYLLKTLQQNDFEIFYGVPYALKILGESSEGLEALAKMKVVMFGGSACPDALGNRLVDNNVNLVSHYGTTETGQLMTSFREAGDKDWDYVRLSQDLRPYIAFEMRSEGIYELIALDGLPSKVASNRPDGSYATKDLFKPHPTTPDAWKYYARMDDTLVLLNGEKHVPTAFEQMIRDNVNVAEAVLFGSNKPRVGMVLIPSITTSGMTDEQILRLLTPVINQANEVAPGYAKLALDMVKVLPVGTPYPRTDKGTVIRAAFYKQFAAEIDAIYDAAEVSSGDLILSEEELRQFLHAEMVQLLSLKDPSLLGEDTDFFALGVDSLQAIQLRGILAKRIDTGGQKLGSNIAFDFPTLRTLARKLYCLRTGETSEAISVEAQMAGLITRYGAFDRHVPEANERDGQYVVVTGATGSLGAHVVAQLIVLDDVKRVYCPVRASSNFNARIRVIRSLRARSIYHNLPLAARAKIIALPSNLADANLGLDEETYTQVLSEITSLIHCAWSVNFNLGLGSFEAGCIAGAHNLIRLCLNAKRPAPASFNFCSSVSAVAATKGGFVPEHLPAELSYAQGMGYARSKLVTEHICILAGKQTGIRARVLRVGQVIGDTIHGIWNDTEAIPLMLQAATTIGAIPTLDESPLWLPVDTVALGVTDIALSNAGAGVMNVVNHQSFHWTRDLLPALHATGLKFEEVGQKEWVGRLRNSNPNPVANPPIKLLEFFASKYDNTTTKRPGLTYETRQARSFSPTLAAAPVLNQDLVTKFIQHWTSTSWTIKPSSTTTGPKPARRPNKLVVLAGPCGAGKSTVARALADKYHVPWIEGDNLHSPASLTKMTNGEALSDADRWAWLSKIKDAALVQFKMESFKPADVNVQDDVVAAVVVIVTCSALKAEYRADLRKITDEGVVVDVTFFTLQTGLETMRRRMMERAGHYMKAEMAEAQVEILEAPGVSETDIVPVDVAASREEVQMEVDALFEDVTGRRERSWQVQVEL